MRSQVTMRLNGADHYVVLRGQEVGLIRHGEAGWSLTADKANVHRKSLHDSLVDAFMVATTVFAGK